MDNKVIERYEHLKEKVELLEAGQWRKDPELASTPLAKVAEMIRIVKILQDAGFDILLKVHQKQIRSIN